MHILLVNRCFYPATEYGGPIWKMQAIGKRLVERGHSVTVYASNLLNPEEKMSDKTFSQKADGLEVTYFNSIWNYRWEPFTPDLISYCKKDLRQFDVIHLYGYRDFLTSAVSYYAHKFDVPYVFEPMGMYVPIVRSQLKKKIYDMTFGKRVMKWAEKVIVTAPQEWEELSKNGVPENKLVLRRNGIELSEFEELPEKGQFREEFGLDPNQLLTLFLGRVDSNKGVHLLIKAFADLKVQAQLVIVGPCANPEYENRLSQLVKKYNLQDQVVFTGPLFGEDKLQAFVDADIFVLPSQHESFGNAVAEAVACNTPVVVTERCGIAPYIMAQESGVESQESRVRGPEPSVKSQESKKTRKNSHQEQKKTNKPYIVGKVGLVIPFDENALHQALQRMITDSNLRERFKQNCPEVKKKLSWEEPVRKMEKIYREIVEKLSEEMVE